MWLKQIGIKLSVEAAATLMSTPDENTKLIGL
jgi:hypothetical protein